MTNTKEYAFMRSKNVIKTEDGKGEMYYLFVGLYEVETFERKGELYKTTNAKFSEEIICTLKEMEEKYSVNYLKLPDHDIRYFIDVDEFNRLERLAIDDKDKFIFYRSEEIDV